MNYKKFNGTIEYSKEDNVYYGKLENIRDLVTYEADTKEELEDSFKEAVDDYLETCEQIGKTPEIREVIKT